MPPEALLSAGADSGPRLAALGALSDSLDFVADAIVRFGERRHQDNSQLQVRCPDCLPGARCAVRVMQDAEMLSLASCGLECSFTLVCACAQLPLSASRWSQAAGSMQYGRTLQNHGRALCLQDAYLGRGRGGGEGTGLTEGLAHLLDRFRASAGMAVRALRLELTLLLVFHIQVRPAVWQPASGPLGTVVVPALQPRECSQCVLCAMHKPPSGNPTNVAQCASHRAGLGEVVVCVRGGRGH